MTWLAAAQAANDALNELGIDTTQAVDPFEAIDRLPLLLAFRPLEHLLGAILPGDPAGVLINSERPVSLQRYTAAHELGHWYLHQDSLQLDTVETIEGRRSSRRELDAQTFAAHFLMPLDLVHATARKYGVGPGRDPLPSDVYQVARDMRVSFEAAIRHLANCKLISSASRDKLLRLRPITVKRELTAGAALADARGDVWLVDESQDGLALEVFVGDTILLRLDERPSTGYRWVPVEHEHLGSVHALRPEPGDFARGDAFAHTPRGVVVHFPREIERVDDGDVLTFLGDEIAPVRAASAPVVVGGPTRRHVRYAASAAGRDNIRLRHTRPFAPDMRLAAMEIPTLVRQSPEIEHKTRYIEAFKRAEAGHGGLGD